MLQNIADNTEISIKFKSDDASVYITIEMTSLKVEPYEINEIFEEHYSGEWSHKLGLSGYGIGMYYAKKLTEINKGKLEFISTNHEFLIDHTPYSDNSIKIQLQKSTPPVY